MANLSASIVRETVVTGFFVSQDVSADGVNAVCLEPVLEGCLGIGTDTASEVSGFFPDVPFEILFDAGAETVAEMPAALEWDSATPSILSRLAGLLTNHAVWLLAVTPGFWSLVVWCTGTNPRQRSHRYRQRY